MRCTHLTECLDGLKRADQAKKRKTGKGMQGCKKAEKASFPYVDYPCQDQDRCERCVKSYDDRKLLVCEERNSKYTLNMGDAVTMSICLHVDAGIVDKDESVRRCDYAFFLKDKDKKLILAELKGRNVDDAIEQLSAMLDWDEISRAYHTKTVKRVYGRIVSTKVPSIYTNERFKLGKRFLKLGGNLKILGRNKEELYSKLDNE